MPRDTQPAQETCVVTRVTTTQSGTFIILGKPAQHPVLGEIMVSALVRATNPAVEAGQVIAMQDLAGLNLNWR